MNALLPASAKRGSNSTPFKRGVVQLLPQSEVFQRVLQPHPVLHHVFRLGRIFLAGDVRDADIVDAIMLQGPDGGTFHLEGRFLCHRILFLLITLTKIALFRQ